MGSPDIRLALFLRPPSTPIPRFPRDELHALLGLKLIGGLVFGLRAFAPVLMCVVFETVFLRVVVYVYLLAV